MSLLLLLLLPVIAAALYAVYIGNNGITVITTRWAGLSQRSCCFTFISTSQILPHRLGCGTFARGFRGVGFQFFAEIPARGIRQLFALGVIF